MGNAKMNVQGVKNLMTSSRPNVDVIMTSVIEEACYYLLKK